MTLTPGRFSSLAMLLTMWTLCGFRCQQEPFAPKNIAAQTTGNNHGVNTSSTSNPKSPNFSPMFHTETSSPHQVSFSSFLFFVCCSVDANQPSEGKMNLMQILYRVRRIKLKDCQQIFCSFTLLYCWTVIREVVDFSISQVLSYKKNYQRSLTKWRFLQNGSSM
jgi:hypothetical protein